MKKGFDPNKVFAAVLLAGLVAAFSGFLSRELIEIKFPKEKGYAPVVTASADNSGGAAEAPKEAEPVDKLMATASAADGEKTARACAACHSFDKGGANRVGPNLFGVVGRPIASHEGFAYSDAIKALKGSWNVQMLNKWLFNPKDVAPGTKMLFPGLPKAQDRANVIKYLQSLQ